MKSLALIFISVFISFSCTKERETGDAACLETPESDELCLAYFESWFYNSETNACTLQGYSGCEPKGFETQAECEMCGCD